MKEKICTVTWEEVEQAAKDACKNHMRKETVLDFCRHWEENVSIVLSMIRDGTYVDGSGVVAFHSVAHFLHGEHLVYASVCCHYIMVARLLPSL